MNLYSSKEHSDEEGPLADEFKLAIIKGSRKELETLCDFFLEVKKSLAREEPLHMHFRDHQSDWQKEKSIDIALEVVD
jgi:hypothetical protein